jgi:putative heme-binding domain-containing protein
VIFVVATAVFAPHVLADDSAASDNTAKLMQLVARSDDAQLQTDVLKGVYGALEGRRHVAAPAGFAEVYKRLGKTSDPTRRSVVRALACIYDDPQAIADMRATLEDPKADAAERRDVLQSLLATGDPQLAPTLQKLVHDEALRDLALTSLASFDDPKTPAVIFNAYRTFDPAARRAAMGTLASRLEYANQLISAVKDRRVPKKDLTAFTVRQLRDLGDAQLNAFVDENFGVQRATPADKAEQIKKLKNFLSDQRVANASASRGRALFAKTCAQCHTLFGTGGTVGPDLTGSQRANVDYVLQNVVDPSAIIAKDYQVTQIRTKDKHLMSGIVTETDHAYKVVTETGTQSVAKENVDKVKRSELSMMPEGLLNGMSESEVADLAAYLRSPKQVALP